MPTTDKPNGQQQQADPHRTWLAQWLTAVFAGLAFAAAAIYAGIASQQLTQMKTSVDQQTAATVAAKDAVKAADASNAITQKQIAESTKEFGDSQRARLVFGNEKGVSVELKDFGQATQIVVYLKEK
jgi:hypothetical protein